MTLRSASFLSIPSRLPLLICATFKSFVPLIMLLSVPLVNATVLESYSDLLYEQQ